MPPRKSTDSTKAPNGAEEPTPTQTPKESSGMSVEDISLPRSMIQRLAKGVLPPNTQIQKDAILAMSKSATVFVNYLANNANEIAMGAGKRTIQPRDVLASLEDLEFGHFRERCEVELKKYTEIQANKRNTYRRRVREEKQAAEAGVNDSTISGETATSPKAMTNGHGDDEGDGEPPATKKARISMDPLNGGEGSHENGANGIGDDEDEDEMVDEDEGDTNLQEEQEDEDGDEEEFHSADSEPEEAEEEAVLEEDSLETSQRPHDLQEHDDEDGSESD